MSLSGELLGQAGSDSTYHQPSYVFTPSADFNTKEKRASKRRKLSKSAVSNGKKNRSISDESSWKFLPLLNDIEKLEFVELRQRLYEASWGAVEVEVEQIRNEANESTLAEVLSFVDGNSYPDGRCIKKIPAGLIVTGPSIALQELLFRQLADRLKFRTEILVVVLRSSDSINLKAVLKKLIRDVTNWKHDDYDTENLQQDGRKLLHYDLQILLDYLTSNKSLKISKVVVVFQDSEGFEKTVLAELITLFNSWLDRIPFTLLFGIATSVELFQERLPKKVICLLHGAQFDVEQLSKTLNTVFQNVIAGSRLPLRLGSGFVTSLLERQRDCVQSLETVVSALKYAYMCHFYANPLSIFLSESSELPMVLKKLQPEHLEAVRILPSFRKTIETYLENAKVDEARALLESDKVLLDRIQTALESRHEIISNLLKAIDLLNEVSCFSGRGPVDHMDMYVKAFSGQLDDSDFVKGVLEGLKYITWDKAIDLTQALKTRFDLEICPNGWSDDESIINNVEKIHTELKALREAAGEGSQLRSKYSIQNKTTRTTVVAQRVQLSQEESTLSKFDISFTVALDGLIELLKDYFKRGSPQDILLHEAWLYDAKSPYREAFTPRPRYAIERALSSPYDYLGCACCKTLECLSSSQPPTAILYQLYLETGGLINIFDLWSAFFAVVGDEGGKHCDERNTLALFYRALADLKMLGMIKQSRRKTDHLAKLAWRGL